MAFRCYRPEAFATTHENIFFREFATQLRKRYEDIEGLHILIGNLSCEGYQLDAIFIASGKIIVIDFKNYGGKLEFSENEPWRIENDGDFVFVAGGGGIKNPFQQVNLYRYALLKYLENSQANILSQNRLKVMWAHIRAVVLFHQSVQFDRAKIPSKISPYFSIADYSSIYSIISDSFSKGLVLDSNEIERLLKALSITEESIYNENDEVEVQETYTERKATERLELVKRLAKDIDDQSTDIRILHYYYTLINLERYKEPKAVDSYVFNVDWSTFRESIVVDVETNPPFNQVYQQNLHEQFKKDVMICVNILLGQVEFPLFYTVFPVTDISDYRRIEVTLSDLSLNLAALESRGLAEDEIEELTTIVNSISSFDAKIQAVEQYLGAKIELISKLTVSLSEAGLTNLQLWSELNSLKRKGVKSDSVLHSYLRKEEVKATHLSSDRTLFCITPINDHQRRAIELAFSQPLSVVTGPPGTGKTQVVLNILANAVIQGKKVLFASKNNRAVDNVREKMSRLVEESSYFLRFGAKSEIRERAIPILQQMSNRISHRLISDDSFEKRSAEDLYNELENKRKYYSERIRSKRPMEYQIRREEQLLQERKSALELWEEKHSAYLANDIDFILSLEQSVRLKANSLQSINGPFGKIIFMLFKRKALTNFHYRVSLALPQLTFSINRSLAANPNNIATFTKWFHDAAEALKTIRSVLEEHTHRVHEINEQEKKVEHLKTEYSTLIKIIPNLSESLQEIESMLPSIGIKVLDEVSRQRIANCKPSTIEKYLSYIPDNIPRHGNAADLFGGCVRELLDTFCAVSVTSLSIKNSFPLTEELFDLVVIDEASQCDVASAIPLVYRAKQLVVIGDPLQLKHITKVESYEEKYLQDKLKLLQYRFDYVNTSLYDHCEYMAKLSNAESILLVDHYRCHPEIINYSNEIFYKERFGRNLNIQTKPEQFPISPSGILWVDTVGTQHPDKNTNRAEAERCVALAMSLAKRNSDITIGITTPFRHQANAIKEMIPEQIRNRVTADTIHRYQGDEKDIMILSLVITDNSSPGKVHWMSTKVPYLINVAVTRARNTLYVVGNAGYCMNQPRNSAVGYLVRYVTSLGKIK